MAYSTAFSLTTGRLPGRPRSTGVIVVFGGALAGAPAAAGLGASLNIFVCVLSSTCTSNPSTGSNSSSALSKSMSSGLAMGSIVFGMRWPALRRMCCSTVVRHRPPSPGADFHGEGPAPSRYELRRVLSTRRHFREHLHPEDLRIEGRSGREGHGESRIEPDPGIDARSIPDGISPARHQRDPLRLSPRGVRAPLSPDLGRADDAHQPRMGYAATTPAQLIAGGRFANTDALSGPVDETRSPNCAKPPQPRIAAIRARAASVIGTIVATAVLMVATSVRLVAPPFLASAMQPHARHHRTELRGDCGRRAAHHDPRAAAAERDPQPPLALGSWSRRWRMATFAAANGMGYNPRPTNLPPIGSVLSAGKPIYSDAFWLGDGRGSILGNAATKARTSAATHPTGASSRCSGSRHPCRTCCSSRSAAS